jgi:hypothetical protein
LASGHLEAAPLECLTSFLDISGRRLEVLTNPSCQLLILPRKGLWTLAGGATTGRHMPKIMCALTGRWKLRHPCRDAIFILFNHSGGCTTG